MHSYPGTRRRACYTVTRLSVAPLHGGVRELAVSGPARAVIFMDATPRHWPEIVACARALGCVSPGANTAILHCRWLPLTIDCHWLPLAAIP